MVATAAALSVVFTLGCSDAKKSTPVKVTNPDGTGNPVDPGKVVSALDSLVKANKGKGVITGFLSGEGKSIAQGLLKQASNAAGERRLLTKSEIPLTGANVLIFNADKPTTAAAATATTDSSGNYTAILDEGKYFGFAVYLDLETFQLVTTQIPNMNAVKDSAVKMDTAVAIEDVTAPTVLGVYDAASANSDGVFLVGSVPATNSKINITFSEPMNRESAKGILLGKVDTSSSTISLADTVKDVELTWSGDNKEVTLNVASLSAGVQYGIIIPATLKDLAKNPLESQFKATFAPVDPKELESVKFAVAATFPENEGGLKPIQNPGLSFNRPVDVFSVVKGATIDPAVTGFWEVIGPRAVFIHKNPLEVGKTYTVSLPDSVKDLTGAKLGEAFSFKFTVKDFEGAAATATGAEKDIALAVEAMFNAYLAGDIGRFSAAFHQNFRMFEGSKIESKAQFIEGMKADIGERVNMRAGVLAPVFDTDTTLCNDGSPRWKVMAKGGTAEDYLWVEAFVNMGTVPRVYGKDKAEIDRSKLEWDRTGPRFKFDGKTYGFAPDFSQFGGGVNMDASMDNMRFMGEIMQKTSTIALEPVKLEMTEEFKVDGGMAVKGDTARLAVKMSGIEKWSRINFEPHRNCGEEGLTHEHLQILKFLLVFDGSRWLVLNIIAPDEHINREDFDKTVDVNNNFGPVDITPMALVSPVNGKNDAADADGKVVFKFNGVKHDSVGGYLVGLAEDRMFIGGRPPFGMLLFVKASKKDGTEETFTLDASAKVSAGNATAVLRRVHDLGLPGWERTFFDYTLSKLYNPDSGFAGVYQWKVIAVKDTSASQFLGNGFKPERFLGESDFGPARGHFAVKGFPAAGQFDQFQNQVFTQPMPGMGPGGPVGFGDMDMDGVPDHMEVNYGTDPRDRNSYPDFRVDTDGDKMADFLEKKLDPEGKDSLVTKAADAAGIKAQIEALAKLNPPIRIMDSDADGFPDDVEQMFGFNAFDANNNPGTRVRATAPMGVFSGKVQMGANTHKVSFKLYQDSTKNLMVAFTAYMGLDTIVDTSRAGFNEIMGEVLMALPLPLDGPDAGRALLFRGNYQAIQSLMMGPVDMIAAPAEGSLNFGSGPYVGQFAASGRGEDVTMYLPGGAGGPMPGPVVGPGPIGPAPTMGYRPPPMGTSEGALIVLAGAKITVIDDFGDTLAVFPNANWRQQPDGSYDVFAEIRDVADDVRKRSEMGGRVMMMNNEWIIDGHFMQEIDSAGNFRHFPGQLCAKVASSGMARATVGLEGTLKGWVALDKTGAGFGGPIGPGPGDPGCQPGMPCGPTDPGIPPTGSFSRPYMGAAAQVVEFERNVLGAEEGLIAPVSIGGRIFQVDLDDSTQLMDAKAPMCGHVVLKVGLVPLKEGASDEAKAARAQDSMMLARMTGDQMLVLIEDQFMPGKPAQIEKARDANGDIVYGVYVAEPRPKPFDYGSATFQCPTNPGPIGPGPIGPGPGDFRPVFYFGDLERVKQALQSSGNMVIFQKDSANEERLSIDAGSLKVDDMKRTITVVVMGQPDMVLAFVGRSESELAIKDNTPVAMLLGSMGGPGPGDHMGPPLYMGSIDAVKQALQASGNKGLWMKDSVSVGGEVSLDPNGLMFDEMKRASSTHEIGNTARRFVFLSHDGGTSLMMQNNMPVVFEIKDEGGTPPPTTGNPPAGEPDLTAYKGTIENLKTLLAAKSNMVKVMVPPPGMPYDAQVDPASLESDGEVTIGNDLSASGKTYVFLGTKMDPTKPMLTPEGLIAVMELEITAGP
jgi:hypothetical protein